MMRIYLRPVGVVMCDVCVKAFLWFYCCCVFYSIRNCGKYWPSNRSM